MSVNKKLLCNIIVLRDDNADQTSLYYMVLNDIVSIRQSGVGVDEVMAVLGDDEFCYLDDIFGKRHKLYYSDLRELNNSHTCGQDELFIILLNTWMAIRDGKNLC